MKKKQPSKSEKSSVLSHSSPIPKSSIFGSNIHQQYFGSGFSNSSDKKFKPLSSDLKAPVSKSDILPAAKNPKRAYTKRRSKLPTSRSKKTHQSPVLDLTAFIIRELFALIQNENSKISAKELETAEALLKLQTYELRKIAIQSFLTIGSFNNSHDSEDDEDDEDPINSSVLLFPSCKKESLRFTIASAIVVHSEKNNDSMLTQDDEHLLSFAKSLKKSTI